MDVTTLLYRNRLAREGDYHRKSIALRNAFAIVQSVDPDIQLEDFLQRSRDMVGRVYGGAAQDSYLTTVMSVVLNFAPDIDVFLASVLNAIVLQMNFQTRIFIDGNQSIVFDGAAEYFPLAMLHGNQTQGLRIVEEAQIDEFPVWVNASPSLEVSSERLHSIPPDQVPVFQESTGNNYTSALLIVNPDMRHGDFSIAERYDYLSQSVNVNTVFCLSGTAEMVFATAGDLQRAHPNLKINVKGYGARGGRDYRAILYFSGLDHLPDVMVRPGVHRTCTFGHALSSDTGDLTSISYASGKVTGRKNAREDAGKPGEVNGIWETATVRRPFMLSSSAPLPLEARERLSDKMEVLHTVLAIKNGILIPSQDPAHATFLCATGDGKVVQDYGCDPTPTPMFQNAQVGDDGVRRGVIGSNKLSRVKGGAMPLMFTPLLHKWHSHFMIQCLPRVRIARDLGEDMTILIPQDLRKKQMEMLELLGFGEDRVLRMDPGELVMADKLYYPWPWRLAFTQYNSAVYDEIAAKVDISGISTPKRVLISRESRKSWRNLINYDAVRQLLVEDYDFEVIAPEKMTLAEEIATYANAEIVVGAEGAGMYGAVFSTPATKYITICDEDYVMPILGSLAAVRGFDIGYVFGESLRSDSDVARRLSHGHADFMIDVARLSKAVRQAIDG